MAALFGIGGGDEAAAKKPKPKPKPKKCKTNQKKCNGKCIPKTNCCTNKECKGGTQCKGGKCKCPTGAKVCGKVCIPTGSCCTNADCGDCQTCDDGACSAGCGDGLACEDDVCVCTEASCDGCCDGDTCFVDFKACDDACIPVNDCCTDADCTGAAAGQCVDGECEAGFAICVTPGGGATVEFVTGDGSPPQSAASAEFGVGANGLHWAHLRNGQFAGTPIDDIETLEYTTFVPDGGLCGMAPYMGLYVTSPEGGIDILLYDPGVDDAPSPVCGEWQTWQPLAGLWRSILHPEFADQGEEKTLAAYQNEFGALSLRNQAPDGTECPGVVGGLRLEVGEGGSEIGGWQNFVGFIDSLRIKIAGEPAQEYEF